MMRIAKISIHQLRLTGAAFFLVLLAACSAFSADIVFVPGPGGSSVEQKQLETAATFYGVNLKVIAVAPRYHSTEDGRWDYRTTIIFKIAEIAHDTFDSGPLLKQLFHDQETYKREEQHRFEILDAHWDVPIKDVDRDAG